jgi:hypothetical protein
MSADNPRKWHIAPRFCAQIITSAACAMRQDARLQCACSLALQAYRHAHDGAFYEQADMHKSKHTHLRAQTYEHDSAQPTHIAIIIPQSPMPPLSSPKPTHKPALMSIGASTFAHCHKMAIRWVMWD